MTTVPHDRRETIRRSARKAIYKPFAMAVLIMVVVTLLMLFMPKTQQTALVADMLLTTLILCPAALILFVLYMAMVFLVIGMGRLNGAVYGPLARLEAMTAALSVRVERLSARVDGSMIGLNERFARVEKTVEALINRTLTEDQSRDRMSDDDAHTE